jgi:hypothetical protein
MWNNWSDFLDYYGDAEVVFVSVAGGPPSFMNDGHHAEASLMAVGQRPIRLQLRAVPRLVAVDDCLVVVKVYRDVGELASEIEREVKTTTRPFKP